MFHHGRLPGNFVNLIEIAFFQNASRLLMLLLWLKSTLGIIFLGNFTSYFSEELWTKLVSETTVNFVLKASKNHLEIIHGGDYT